MKDMGSTRTKIIREYETLKSYKPVTDLPNEAWVDVVGYEGVYKISNFFRVKSVSREVDFRGGKMKKPEQIRIYHPNQDGYYTIRLTKNGKATTLSLHILMAKSFNLPNPNNHNEINHIDGDKKNCLISNLEWSSRKANMQHAVKSNLRTYNDFDNRKFKLTEDQIVSIYQSEDATGRLAKKYGVTKSSIQRIKSGKTYSAITLKGERISTAYRKLSQDTANEIRNSDLTQKELCKKYGVSKGLVYNIKNNISYI